MCLVNCNCFKSTSKFPNTVTVCCKLSSESLFIDVLGKQTMTDLFSQYKMLRYAEMHVYLYKKCTFAISSSTTETRASFPGHVKFFVDDVDGRWYKPELHDFYRKVVFREVFSCFSFRHDKSVV